MSRWRQGILTLTITALLAGTAYGADAHMVQSKLRAKFSGEKITVKGKVVGSGEWPLGLRIELVDGQDNEIASASDSLRGGESFQIELAPAKGQKFERADFLNARVRYWVRRGRKEEESGAVALAEICPNLVQHKRKWWPW